MSTSGEALVELDGLSFLGSILRRELPPAPMSELLGFELTEVAEGRVAFEAVPEERHYNPLNSVHGGLALTMLDSAAGAAVHSTLLRGQVYGTLETKVNMVRAITAETGPIVAEGRVVHRGTRTATAEGTLRVKESGELLAHGTSTCMILGG